MRITDASIYDELKSILVMVDDLVVSEGKNVKESYQPSQESKPTWQVCYDCLKKQNIKSPKLQYINCKQEEADEAFEVVTKEDHIIMVEHTTFSHKDNIGTFTTLNYVILFASCFQISCFQSQNLRSSYKSHLHLLLILNFTKLVDQFYSKERRMIQNEKLKGNFIMISC